MSLLVVVGSVVAVAPVGAQPGESPTVEIVSVVLVPVDGTTFEIDGRTYGGTIDFTLHSNGLSIVEETDLDGYLAGIAEVPISWPDEALRAQVVAARSYLAWTLDRGRSGDGNAYDFDICATTQCQVYAGTGLVDGPGGDRWLAAVADTSGEVLMSGGSPAQALYSSSAGSRTRSVQDVFGGDAKPYLQAVESPENDDNPFREWELSLDVDVLRGVLAASGRRLAGEVTGVRLTGPGEGRGTETLVIETSGGGLEVPVVDLRAIVNVYGPRRFPGLLPTLQANGRRWPQAFLSYTVDARFEPGPGEDLAGLIPPEDAGSDAVVFTGEGWGHGVGMSQWGAYAMALDGASYDEILAHYYGGLRPRQARRFVPETVRIGLAWGRDVAGVTASGEFEMRVNDVPLIALGAGEWRFSAGGDGITVGSPPDRTDLATLLSGRAWPR